MRLDPWDLLRLCTVDPRRNVETRRSGTGSVVHLVPSLGWGGAERLAATLHRLALAAGWTSRIDAPSLLAVQQGFAAELGTPAGPLREDETLHEWALAARRRLAHGRPDVVHVHLPYPDRLGAARIAARGRPMIATFQLLPQEGRWWSVDEVLPWRSDNVLHALARLPGRARFVAVSRRDEARLATHVPAARLVRIPNAPPFARTQLPSLAPLEWPMGQVRMLSVGRLHAQKGFDQMLTALGADRVRPLPWHWVIAGDGEERTLLEARIAALGHEGRVAFASGHPASLLYADADLVLCPSRWEGMPLVPMEAVEARVPVICSPIEPHRELFTDVPDTLLPEDPARWADTLAPLIAETERRGALRDAQVHARPTDPRAAMWRAYETLYRALS